MKETYYELFRRNNPYLIEIDDTTKTYIYRNRDYHILGTNYHVIDNGSRRVYLYNDVTKPTSSKKFMKLYEEKLYVTLKQLLDYKFVVE